jgi:hypothetical protein
MGSWLWEGHRTVYGYLDTQGETRRRIYYRNLSDGLESGTGRQRSTVKGKACQMLMGSLIQHSTWDAWESHVHGEGLDGST